jgi:acyl-CoA thioester hydrolase
MTTIDRASPEPRSAYRHFRALSTQWRDNDLYGHVNNAVHYAWFDTLVNAWLIEKGLLQLAHGEVVGLVVSTSCQFFAEAAFPDRIDGGLRVERIGRSSVVYGLGLYRNDEPLPFAAGRFVHVYVDRATRRPVALPAGHLQALHALSPPDPAG